MTRALLWARAALEDLSRQIEYIAEDNPLAARRVAESLDLAAQNLARRAIGRPGRVPGTFEKSVPRLPYVIAYALDDRSMPKRLVILRIIHTARNWSPGSWPD